MAGLDDNQGSLSAREWASTIPQFEASARRVLARLRPHLAAIVLGGVVVWLVWQQLLFWAVLVGILFLAASAANHSDHLRRWMLWAIVRLRGVETIVWDSPAQDADHETARAEFGRIMQRLHDLPRDVDGDGRVERRKWLYAATEQADGLMIRGDNPYYAIRTRTRRATSAPAQLGFVGAAAALSPARWPWVMAGVLAAVAALLYGRGEVLEARLDRATTTLAVTETALSAERAARMAAEANSQQWQARLDGDIRAALEQSTQTRVFFEEQQARQRRLNARRADRDATINNPSGGAVDLSDSLRNLAGPASLPALPSPAPGSDPAGGMPD